GATAADARIPGDGGADGELLSPSHSGLLGADGRDLGRREPPHGAARHPRLGEIDARRVPRRRRRRQSLPRARRRGGVGPLGYREQAEARRAGEGQRLQEAARRPPAAAAHADGSGRAIEAIEGGQGAVRQAVRRPLRRHARMGRARIQEARQRLGTRAVLRDHLMAEELKVISPIDGSVVVRRKLTGAKGIAAALAAARKAQREWRAVPLAGRIAICQRFVAAMLARKQEIGAELTRQMGRPIRYTPMEVERMCERADAMMALAPEGLADVKAGARTGFTRFIRKEPLGVVMVIAPWNYPFLTAVNAVVPAILAGNAVILKHSSQTPLVAERFAEGFAAAGLPAAVMQVLHISHDDTEKLVASDGIDFVAFT